MSGYNFDLTTENSPLRTRAARDEGRIDIDAAYAFARATNDGNSRYGTGEAVPPLFTATLILDAQNRAHEEGDRLANVQHATGNVHRQHDVYFHGRIRPDTDVHWAANAYSAHQTKGGVLLIKQIIVSGADGPLVEHQWSNFFIGGTIDEEFGPPLADHTFPAEARSKLVASRTVTVQRDQTFRYAGVSGDHVGHAIDDDMARAEGRPGKILQGMCTFGLASGAVVDLAADGDPDRLARLAVRFAAPAYPAVDLVVSVYDAGWNAQGGRAFAFEGTQNGVAVLRHGRVELKPE